MNFPPLYKISATGGVLEWKIWTEGQYYFVESGYQDGQKQQFHTQIINKRNSVSLEEQSEKEAASKYALKKKTYYLTVEEAQNAASNKSMALGGYSPMLAFDMEKYKSKFNFGNAYIQPKLDGKRTLARKIDGEVLLYARSGALNETTPHINRQLEDIMEDGEIFDGELYNHSISFEELIGKVQAKVNLQDTNDVQYWIYDFPKIGDLDEKAPYSKRMEEFSIKFPDDFLDEFVLTREEKIAKNILFTPTYAVDSFAKAEALHTEFTQDGYEGAILRNPYAPYENKRSKNLLKFKKFQDAEFLVVGTNEGKGKLKNHVGSFVCQLPDGRTFNAKMDGETEQLAYYFEHLEEVIGKWMNVRFFSYTKDQIPRFPVGIRLRDKVV
jgi:DNA ligase 1